MSEEIEEVGELAIEVESHLLHFRRIRPNLVTENVVGRKADRKQIRGGTAADVLVNHQLFSELEFVFVAERGGADHFVETCVRAVFALAVRRGAKNRSLRVLPVAIPIFRGARRVEILRPLRQVVAVVGGGDPCATLGVDPVGCVSCKAGGKHGGAWGTSDRKSTRL